ASDLNSQIFFPKIAKNRHVKIHSREAVIQRIKIEIKLSPHHNIHTENSHKEQNPLTEKFRIHTNKYHTSKIH
ncbi:hypothetical protein NQU36_29665, partial [Escherichia coli]|uniref:hypothetical protein n=1 Tax=Escherichia coli TaxID=562 RepID=UPI0021179E54